MSLNFAALRNCLAATLLSTASVSAQTQATNPLPGDIRVGWGPITTSSCDCEKQTDSGTPGTCSDMTSTSAQVCSVDFNLSLGTTKYSRITDFYHTETLPAQRASIPFRFAGMKPFYKSSQELRDYYLQAPLTARLPLVLSYAMENITWAGMEPTALGMDAQALCETTVDPTTHALRQIRTDDLFVDILPLDNPYANGSLVGHPELLELITQSSIPIAYRRGFLIRTWKAEDMTGFMGAPTSYTVPSTGPLAYYIFYGIGSYNSGGVWSGGVVNIVQKARFGGSGWRTKSWTYSQNLTPNTWVCEQSAGLPTATTTVAAGTVIQKTVISDYVAAGVGGAQKKTIYQAAVDATGSLGSLMKVSETSESYGGFGGLQRMSMKQEGQRTTRCQYYSVASDSNTYGRLKWQSNPDGSFEYYDYTFDPVSLGATVLKYTPFGNYKWTPSGSSPPDFAQCILETTTIGTAGNSIDHRTTIGGVETDRRSETWTTLAGSAGGLRIHTENTYTNGVDMLTQITAYYPPEGAIPGSSSISPEYQANRMAWRELSDGTAEIYTYTGYGSSLADATYTQTIRKGAGDRNGVTEGIETVSKRNRRRVTVEETVTYVSAAGNTQMSHWISPSANWDDFGRPLLKTWNGDSNDQEKFEYDCCGLSSYTDRYGILTEYKRDDLKRIYEIKRTAGGASGFILDDRTQYQPVTGDTGVLVTTKRTGKLSGTVSSEKTIFANQYNLTGELVSTTTPNPSGSGTVETGYEYHYAMDATGAPTGGRTRTVTYPDGSQKSIEYQVDGRLSSISGNAVPDEQHTYESYDNGAGIGGIKETLTKLTVTAGTSETKYLYSDEADRLVKEEFPTQLASPGQNDARTISYYSGASSELGGRRGSKWVETDADGVKKTFDYDARGNSSVMTESVPNSDSTTTPPTPFEQKTTTTYDATTAAGFGVGFSGTGPAYRKTTKLNGTTIEIELTGSYERVSSTQNYTRTTKVETNYTSAGAWTQTRIEADGTKTIGTYTNGSLMSLVHTDGGSTTLSGESYTYDPLGRVASKSDQRTSASGTISYEYSDGDLVLWQKESSGRGTKFTYDVMGRKTAAIPTDSATGASLNQESYFSYYPDGDLKATWGKQAYQTYRKYDEQGRMTELRTYQSLSTAVEPVEGSAGGNEVTTWSYDPVRGWLTAKRASGQGVDYTYTAAGHLETRQWARTVPSTTTRVKTTYNYAYGILTGIDYNDGTPAVAYNYNTWGGVANVTRGGALDMSYTYDGNFQVLTEQPGPPPAPMPNYYPYLLTRKWDPLVRPLGYVVGTPTVANATSEVSYGYDTVGRLATVTYQRTPGATAPPAAQTFTYGYNYTTSSSYHVAATTGGTPSEIPFAVSGPGYKASRSYETNRDVLHAISNAASSTVLSSSTYGVNDLNQRSGVTQAGTAFSGTPDMLTWSYDDLGQLYASGSSAHNATDSRYYGYDNIGNRRQSRTGTTSTSGGTITNYYSNTFGTITGGNTLNQYAKISGGLTAAPVYDADGNVIDDGNLWTYTWDAENRMIKAETRASSTTFKQKVLYGYDYLGRQIMRTRYNWDYGISNWVVNPETFSYLYDGWNRIASTVNYGLLRDEYVWGLDVSGTMHGAGGVGGMLLWQGSTDAYSSGTHNYSYYPAYDGYGNVTELVNSSGAVAAHWEYDPYGKILRSSPTTSDWDAPVNHFSFGFSTKPRDDSSGFYYYGYRSYDPATGRWSNRDPLGENGGENLYAFVYNDPMNFVDRLGLDAVPAAGGGFNFQVNPKNFDSKDMKDLAKKLDGKYVTHPNPQFTGQCATGAQLLAGDKEDGKMHDAASTKDWEQGAPLSPSTPPGTMIAKGWVNGKYPNTADSNHTGISMGDGKILEQNVHTPSNEGGAYQQRDISKEDGWFEVKARCPCEKKPSQSKIEPTRTASGK